MAAYSDVAKAAVDSVEKALPSDVLTQSLQQSKKACEDLLRTIGGQRYEVTSAAASMRELLAVEEKSAAQKEIISRRVDELNEAVPELGLAYDSVSDSINMTGDALERLVEKSAEQQEYEARVSRLSELYIEQEKIALELEAAREALSQAEEAGAESVQILQESVSQLTTAQEENAVQIRDLESLRLYGGGFLYGRRQGGADDHPVRRADNRGGQPLHRLRGYPQKGGGQHGEPAGAVQGPGRQRGNLHRQPH